MLLLDLLGGRFMAGAVLPWAGEFQVKIISACLFSAVLVACCSRCLNFVVQVRSGACQFRTTEQLCLFKAG